MAKPVAVPEALLEVIEAHMLEDDVQSIARLGSVNAPLLRIARTRIQASESTASIRVRHALSALSSAVERFRVGDRESPLPLSPRETEVLVALARGASNKVIARTLQMTDNTVKFHRSQSAEGDVFDLEIFVDSMTASLSPEATLLDAAKGDFGCRDQSFIDADYPVFQSLCDPENPAHVPSIEIARQSKGCGVGQSDRLFLSLEAEEWRDRAERLFAEDQSIGGDICQDRWLKEVPAKRMTSTTRDDVRSLL